jgi:uncharacterized protein YqeY
MTISEKVKKQIIDAMKAKDELRVSTLKLLSAALHNEYIEKQKELSEDQEMAVVAKEAKKRKDAIEAYESAGAKDKADKEKKELEILQEYLPEELTDDELQRIVDEVIKATGASSMQDMGKVMGAVVGKCKGRADGKRISELVRSKLS